MKNRFTADPTFREDPDDLNPITPEQKARILELGNNYGLRTEFAVCHWGIPPALGRKVSSLDELRNFEAVKVIRKWGGGD
jgi:hypothetical protein